jgi:rRNA maturation RNase YbeY
VASKIVFISEEIDFTLKNKLKIRTWLTQIIQSHGFKLSTLNFIFCNDDYLLNINIEYLNHHTLTDIITFDNAEDKGNIDGDIFISIDRVKENAGIFKVTFEKELLRVLAHGTLHLLGFKDKNAKDQKEMTSKEDQCLSLWSIQNEFIF